MKKNKGSTESPGNKKMAVPSPHLPIITLITNASHLTQRSLIDF